MSGWDEKGDRGTLHGATTYNFYNTAFRESVKEDGREILFEMAMVRGEKCASVQGSDSVSVFKFQRDVDLPTPQNAVLRGSREAPKKCSTAMQCGVHWVIVSQFTLTCIRRPSCA